MFWIFRLVVALFVLIPLGTATEAAHAEKRIALVIGNRKIDQPRNPQPLEQRLWELEEAAWTQDVIEVID